MAIGDILSDADLNALSPAPADAGATFSDADIAAMEDQSKAQGDLNSAANTASADTQSLRQSYGSAVMGTDPQFQENPSTGLGPINHPTLSTADLDKLEASTLDDPTTELNFDQWKSAKDAAHRQGMDTFGYGLSQIPGTIAGLFQTAWGGIKEVGSYVGDALDSGDMKINPGTPSTDNTSSLVNTGLEGLRKTVLNTELNAQKVGQWLDTPGNAKPESPDQRDQRLFRNWQDNQMFNREIAQPTVSSISAVPIANQMGSVMPDAANAVSIAIAPENLVAEVAGGLIAGAGISNLAKAATGRVFQALGNGGIVIDDAIQAVADGAAQRIQNVTGLTPETQQKALAYGAGAAGLYSAGAATHGEDGGNPIWAAAKPVLGYLALRNGAATVRTISRGAQVLGTVFREAADPMGPLRAEAFSSLSQNTAIPKTYRDAMTGAAVSGIDSTPSRIANSTDYPGWVRVFADKVNNPVMVGTSRLLGSAAEGSIGGALSMLPLTLGSENDAQTGNLIGTGAIFGAAGGLVHRVVGSSAAEQRADVARFLADTQLASGDAVKAANLPTPQLHELAALQGLISLKGGDVIAGNQDQFNTATAQAMTGEPAPGQPGIAGTETIPLSATDFEANRAGLGGSGAAGWYFDAQPGQRPRLFINLDAKTPAGLHEFAHAITGSQVMDGGLRSDVRNWVQTTYANKIEAMSREYAQRAVEAQNNDLTQRAVAAGHPKPQFPPLEDQITAKVHELNQNSLAAGNSDPFDWVRDEIFAEHINQAGININDIRRGLPPSVHPEVAAQNILAAQARILGAAGAPIDPQTGAVTQPLSTIFRDNPLIGSSPELSRQLAKYVHGYAGWLNGMSQGAKAPSGTLLSRSGSPYEIVKSGGVVLRPVEGRPGVFENDFLRNDNGTITYKPQSEINQVELLRKQQLANALGTKLRPATDPTLGPRMVDGKRVIQGSQLPENMGALKHFGPWIQSLFGTFKQHEGLGTIFMSKYNRIGTGESGSYRILKMGNLRSEMMEHSSPFLYSVSGPGNLLAHVVDITNVRKKLFQAINEGRLPYHENNSDAVMTSLDKYLQNFKQGLPSENGIGIGKRNEINALLFTGSKTHRAANALAGDYGPQGCVRAIRMDRIEDMNPAVDNDPRSATFGQPKQGFHFDYFKVNNNMSPVARPGSAMLPDAVTGEVLDSHVQSRTANDQPVTEKDLAGFLPYGRDVGRMRQTKGGNWQVTGPSGKPSTYPNFAKAIKRSDYEVNMSRSINELKSQYGPEDRKAITAAQQRITEVSKNNPEAIRLEIARDKETGLPKIDKLYDADGEPSLDAKGKHMRGVIYNKESYGLRNAPGLSKDDATAVHQAADLLVNHTNKAIQDPSIAAGVGWYGRMRDFLQKAFGANIELFGQLLGATSARTPVDTNFKQALEAIRLFSQGKYDDLLESFAKHINEVHAQANSGELLKKWLDKSSKNNEGNFDLEDAVRKEVNKFEGVPLRQNGAKYNANSQKVLHALYGNWIDQTVGPKTPNFAGNLTGRTLKATIDVWAARNLRRLLYERKVKRWRILPEQEQAVSSGYNKAGELTGDFPFAQKIYDEAASRLGMNPDDLQALIWFAEKDVWDRNNWTNKVGAEKSSFDKEAGKLDMDRYQGGITNFQNTASYDPVLQNQERLKLRAAASQIPGLQASRISHSEGLYGSVVEPTIDAELSVQRNPDGTSPSIDPFVRQLIKTASDHNQSDAFVSMVVDASHPNARPMVEIGFKHPATQADVSTIISRFQKSGIDGFTISKDSHGRVLGVRAQYIPEISARYEGGANSHHLDPSQFVQNSIAWANKTRSALVSLHDLPNVSYKEEGYVSTHTYGHEEYHTTNPGDLRTSISSAELGRRKSILANSIQQ